MPLIDVIVNPRFKLQRRPGLSGLSEAATVFVIKSDFARSLPALMVEHAVALGLDPNTPNEGVQVMNHNYDTYDVNPATVWVKFQFSEEMPAEEERIRIRDHLYDLIVKWFYDREYRIHGLVIDLLWGPTNGKGMVGVTTIDW